SARTRKTRRMSTCSGTILTALTISRTSAATRRSQFRWRSQRRPRMRCSSAATTSWSLERYLYRYLGNAYPRIPFPLGNVLGGGAHAPGATDIQEFLVSSVGAKTIDDAVLANTLVHKRVKKILTDSGIQCGKGDEGGWAPHITDAKAFEFVSQAVKE